MTSRKITDVRKQSPEQRLHFVLPTTSFTSRRLREDTKQDELKEINRPRAEAMATPKPKAKPNLKTWMDIFGGLGFWRHAAKDKGRGVAVKAASTTVLEDCTDVDNDASTTVAGPSTARDGSGSI